MQFVNSILCMQQRNIMYRHPKKCVGPALRQRRYLTSSIIILIINAWNEIASGEQVIILRDMATINSCNGLDAVEAQ